MGGASNTNRDSKGAYRVLVGRPEGKRWYGRLGRNRRILQYMIKKENDEGAGTIHRIDQAQDRDKWQSVVKMVMNHRIL